MIANVNFFDKKIPTMKVGGKPGIATRGRICKKRSVFGWLGTLESRVTQDTAVTERN